MMAVTLFTFRELLKLLGVEDYGTYNAVAGVVILFSFLSNAMTQSNQRFLAYNLGKNDSVGLSRTFSMIINVHLIITAVIFVLAESFGLWFINCEMNFEPGKMAAVNWVYQLSILTFLVQILQIPYTSAIIAHEKMAFFSYFSIGEAILKLLVVLSLVFFTNNRLILYSLLLSIRAIIVFMVYWSYCNKAFSTCRYKRFWDKSMFTEILSFSGWNMLGGLGTVCSSQGINILFNIFCGVIVNAAMGVAQQVHGAVSSMVGNILTAFNPQIVKSYAAEDFSYFISLIFRSVRLSFYLILIVGIPIIVCAKPILSIWLDEVPNYSVQFVQLTIAYCMIDAISGPLWTANQASGKVKNYMIIVSIMVLTNIPFAYVLLKNELSPVWVMALRTMINMLIMIFRILYLRFTIQFPAKDFLIKVVGKALLCIFIVGVLAIFLANLITEDSVFNQLILFTILVLISLTAGYFVLLVPIERKFVVEKISCILGKFCRKSNEKN